MPAYVYLLCFERPLPSGNRPRHYVGSTGDLGERLRRHRKGYGPREGGARLTQVMREQGIAFGVARVWALETLDAARELERQLKRQRHHARHCPHCRQRTAKGQKEAA